MSKHKILVIDDDRDMLRMLSAQLGPRGYEVVWATDGVAAISSARKEQPDAIVLDLGLPAGDGFVCLDRLQRSVDLAQIPVIVLTAREREGVEAKALQAGAACFLEKSSGFEELVSELERQIPTVATA